MKNPKTFCISDTMLFGKYKGWTIEQIIDQDPSYVTWLIENTAFQMENEAFKYYQEKLDEV